MEGKKVRWEELKVEDGNMRRNEREDSKMRRIWREDSKMRRFEIRRW